MATEDQVRDLLIVLSSAFPNFELKPQTIQIYASLLADIPAETLRPAAYQVLAESKFFPSVAEIRSTALAIVARADGTPTTAEAWAEVEDRLRWPGIYAVECAAGVSLPLEFSHPLIRRAVDAMGWLYLCESTDHMADRAHFFRLYGEFAERERKDAAMLPEVREVIQRLAQKMRVPALTEGAGR